jgi:uncharacterized membrane protein
MLWANLHLLFWLSLVPFTTGWMRRQGQGLVGAVRAGHPGGLVVA